MKLGEIEAILGKPTEFGVLAIAPAPDADGRRHVDLSNLMYGEKHYAQWFCMLPRDGSVRPGMQESIGRYCLAVEDDGGDWTISASCTQHKNFGGNPNAAL